MMRHLALFTLYFAFTNLAFGQNLIPDPSAEDVVECPSSYGNIDIYTSSWQSFRGTPDYWHSCSTNEGLGWNNAIGYQEPRSGQGYLGGASYSTAFPAREYLGTELLEPMEIGQTYYMSFYVSLAYRVSGGARIASNNLGILLMTENYFDPDEGGEVFNFSHLRVDTIISDTTNWVLVSGSIVADSAYTLVAYGNFYDDSQTIFEYPFAPDNVGEAHYYYDDFCLSSNPDECDNLLNAETINLQKDFVVFPNPAYDKIHFRYPENLLISIYDISSQKLAQTNYSSNEDFQLDISAWSSGMYFIIAEDENGIQFSKKWIKQ